MVMKNTVKIILVLVLLTFFMQTVSAQSVGTTQEHTFDILIGDWVGEGVSFGVKISDSVSFSTVDFSEHHLRFKLKEIGGNLTMEGFLYEGSNLHYSFYEFNNGKWPNRQFSGFFDNNRFSLTEQTTERNVLLEIILHGKDSFQIRESFVDKEGNRQVFVDEMFRRVSLK